MCHAHKKENKIRKGHVYLSIKDGLNEKSYCLECSRRILEKGRERLNSLIRELEENENLVQSSQKR